MLIVFTPAPGVRLMKTLKEIDHGRARDGITCGGGR
jgi:hypothetical protein